MKMLKLWREFIPELLMVVAIFLFYLPTISFPIMEGWDDHLHILRNSHLAWTVDNLLYWWKTPIIGIYMPLTMWSYMLNYACGGLVPEGYHLVNIGFHALAVVAAYRCFRYFGIKPLFACFFLLLFAFHPQRIESVVWLSERKDVMCAAFYLLAVNTWLRWRDCRWGRLATWGWFAAALLCKPMAVSLPLVLILIELWQRKEQGLNRLFILRLIPFFLASLLIGLVTVRVQVVDPGHYPDLWHQFWVGLHNVMWYVRTAFIPVGLVPIYPRVEFFANVIWGMGFFYAVTVVLVWLMWRRTTKTFMLWSVFPMIAAFLVIIAPVVGFFQLGTIDYADRYSYLPTLVLWLAVAAVVRRSFPFLPRLFRSVVVAIGIVYFLVLAFAGSSMLYAWKDYNTLLQGSCAVRPANFIAIASLGLYEEDHGHYERLTELAEMIQTDLPPGADKTHLAAARLIADYFQASILERLNRHADAIKLYEPIAAALERRTLFVDTFFIRVNSRLAMYYMRQGKTDAAMACLDRLKNAYSDREPESFFFAGMKNYFRREYAAAAVEFRRALQLSPGDPKIIFNLEQAELRAKTPTP